MYDVEEEEEFLEDNMTERRSMGMVETEDGRTVLLSKDYRQTTDIVTAYKSLKVAVSKAGNRPTDIGRAADANKGYLKMTIAM